jgi:hypothetical protein
MDCRLLALILFAFLVPFNSVGQHNFRIKSDFSIKEKTPDGTSKLIMGKVYYDKNYKKLIYDIAFPEKETIVIKDSTFYRFKDGKLKESKGTSNLNDFSIFHLSLNGNLSYYGLDKSVFELKNVENDNGLIISTWMPPAQFSKIVGKTMVSQKAKKLHGVVSFNPSNEILSKTFFKDYQNIKAIDFPQEMIQISYVNGKEFYKLTSFKNLVVDEMQNENIYNFKLPD